jgi:ubiquinone/menaquinone biosynthesis C-methylase UbiE
MDYDKTEIASGYNRGRDHGPAFRTQWMNAVAARVEPQSIRSVLDLGCGTGRFSQELAGRFDCNVVGIDPSTKMLNEARAALQRERVFYACGSAETIPLGSECVDLVFISMVFHHFTHPQLAAQECRRVLRPHGRVCLRTGSRERIPHYPQVPFFPASRPLMEQHLPTLEFQRDIFAAAGFTTVSAEVITQEIAPDLFAYSDKLATKSDSILVRLADEDFDAGLKALHARAAATAPHPVTEPIDFVVFGKAS